MVKLTLVHGDGITESFGYQSLSALVVWISSGHFVCHTTDEEGSLTFCVNCECTNTVTDSPQQHITVTFSACVVFSAFSLNSVTRDGGESCFFTADWLVVDLLWVLHQRHRGSFFL